MTYHDCDKVTERVDTMAEKKMSYAVAVESAINGELTPEVIERLTALKASLAKRSQRSGKPTKAQIANEALAEQVFAAMESGVDYTIADIRSLVPELETASVQKIAPLMKRLGDKVVKAEVKGKAVYHLA